MKKLNIALGAILFLMLAFAAYFWLGGTLRAEVSTIAASAADHPDAYAAVGSALASGAAPQVFAELPASPDGLTLMDVTVALGNPGLFAAEWLDISLTGAPGDIAVYSLSGEASDVPARAAAQVNLKLITTQPDAPRALTIDYYVLGMPRSISLAL